MVVLDHSDYVARMHTILMDKNKFNLINTDLKSLLIKQEDKFNRFLRQLKKNNSISEDEYASLFASGSTFGRMYGLPKTHKEGTPLRPILSALGTLSYKVAKFLVPLIEPLVHNVHNVSDSFSFVRDLHNLDASGLVMASFDVVSLFTNIPLDDTIKLCTDELFNRGFLFDKFSKLDFGKLLSFAVKDCHFLFNKKVFCQTDGVAMGSPLGPVLANSFLAIHEEKWLEECPSEFKPILYKRYVDDTFTLFRDTSHIVLFLNYLNSRHKCIKFTVEHESDCSLPFLDVLIKRMGATFTTSVYRKPSFSGLGMKFGSFLPINYKRNIICTLVYRAFMISSNYAKFHLDILFLKNFFSMNGFPMKFVETYIGKTLTNLITPKPPSQPSKEIIYFALPFLGGPSFALRNKVLKLFTSFFPNYKLQIVFSCLNTIGHNFVVKDKVPFALQSSLVYKYNCGACNASYVGKTSRHLFMRIAEHKGTSFRTNVPLSKPPFSAIRDHAHAHDHPISDDNFKVLSTAHPFDLCILETLHMHQIKPTLCSSDSSTQLVCL